MIVTKVLCVAEKHDAAKNIAKFLSNGKMETKKGGDKYIYNFSFNSKFVTSINIY
jgi:DNA topoisomerase IA